MASFACQAKEAVVYVDIAMGVLLMRADLMVAQKK